MRRSSILCSVVLLLLIGCSRQEQEGTISASATPSFPPPPNLINNTLSPDQIIFIMAGTGIVGTDPEPCNTGFRLIDGPWSYEYFGQNHHLTIHDRKLARSELEGHVLVGYEQWWEGSIGGGYATPDYAILKKFPYTITSMEDTQITAVDASGSIVLDVAGEEYWIEPGRNWAKTENTIQDSCHVKITYFIMNYGLMDMSQIWIDH